MSSYKVIPSQAFREVPLPCFFSGMEIDNWHQVGQRHSSAEELSDRTRNVFSELDMPALTSKSKVEST